MEKIGSAETYITQWQWRIDSKLAEVPNPFGMILTIAWCTAFAGFIMLMLTAMITATRHNGVVNFIAFPPVGWLFVGFIIVGLLAAAIIAAPYSAAGKRVREPVRKNLELERNAHPLYTRAVLLVKAIQDYKFHLGQYMLMCDQVDDGLVAHSADIMGDAYSRLDRARQVLMDACDNFNHVVEYDRRQKEFIATHPELNHDPSTSNLAALLAELGKPLEFAPNSLMAAPVDLLNHDTALQEVVHDFAQPTELSQQQLPTT